MIGLIIPTDKARRMTRSEYYAARRWCRITTKILKQEIEQHQERFGKMYADLMTYGTATINMKELT